MTSARRPPAPAYGGAAWALAILGPVLSRLLVSALVPLDRCGKFGLDCVFYLLLGAVGSWCVGTGLAVYSMRRGETRWVAISALVVNLLPIGAIVVFFLRILIR